MLKWNPRTTRFSGVIVIACLICCWMASSAMAHSLFIQSSRYKVTDGKRTPLFFCYGHHVPVDDGVRAKKLKSVKVQTPTGEVREIAVRNETSLHSYMIEYDAPGTWVLSAETNPGFYTVYIDKKGRERHTIKPKSAIADRAKEVKTSLFSKQYAKSYVVCDASSETFPARIGLPLELVPTKDISQLKVGETLELKVYFNGKPYSGQGTWDATLSGYSTASEDNFYPKTKLTGDTVRIPIPHAGRWFVRYFIKIDAQGADRANYTQMKNTATLVFQIPNPRHTPPSGSH